MGCICVGVVVVVVVVGVVADNVGEFLTGCCTN